MVSKEENILLAAEKLFSEKGFNGTSTREISKAANVNISMISYYFGSKEKLFERIFEYRMKEGNEFASSVLNKKDINAWEKLMLITDRYVERVKKMKSFYLILQREQIKLRNPEIVHFLKTSKKDFLELYDNIVSEGIESGIFTERPDMEFLHSTISGTLFTAMNTLPFYREFFPEIKNYETDYYDRLSTHLKKILKHLLGYEQNL